MGKIMKKLQKGDVVGVTRDNLISNIIEKVIDGEVSHVALYIGKGLILEATLTGVSITNAKKYKSYKILRFPERIDKDRLVKDCKTKLGVKYSLLQLVVGLVLIFIFKLFKLDWNVYQKNFPDLDRKGMVCSELIAWGAMKQVFKFGLKRTASNVTPADFEKYLENIT